MEGWNILPGMSRKRAREKPLPIKKVQRPRPPSGFYGVTADKKRWKAQIHYSCKQHSLGTFDTRQEAALAYERAARKRKEDKPLNYQSITEAEEACSRAQADYTLMNPHPKQPRMHGVSICGKRWAAQIRLDGKSNSLGTFDTKQEAALAYDRAARQCGKPKRLNYESIKAAEEAATQAQIGHTLVHKLSAGPKQHRHLPPSGFYGVRASRHRWQAEISYDSKTYSLGTFNTKQEAALAYDKAGRDSGKDKPLNFESITEAEEAATEAKAEHAIAHPQQQKPRPPSGFYGVSADKERWRSKISYDSKKHNLGTFNTRQEAGCAYDRAARQHGGGKPTNYETIEAAEEAATQARAEHSMCAEGAAGSGS
jgi:hypothetical protein